MDSNLLHEAVKALVNAVRNFLNADDGCDDDRIEAMSKGVHDVLTEARKSPRYTTGPSRRPLPKSHESKSASPANRRRPPYRGECHRD